MSTRFNDGSHYENHQRAAELHEGPEHAHRAAGDHGQQEHETGHEQTRQTLEHSEQPHQQPHAPTVGHGIVAFGHKEIAALAYALWQAKGCPEGSAEEDWFQAAKELRARAHTP